MSSLLDSGVDMIYSNWAAFAATKSDGSVITWGDEVWGGDKGNVDICGSARLMLP